MAETPQQCKIKRHGQEGADKASAKIKERSVDKSSRKSASLDTGESWCICGGPESGEMITCEKTHCPVMCYHVQYEEITTAPNGE